MTVVVGTKRASSVIDLDAPARSRRRVAAPVIDLTSDEEDASPVAVSLTVSSAVAAPVTPTRSPAKPRVKRTSPQKPAQNKRSVSTLITLAKPWAPGKDVSGWYMSEKLDGMRALYIGGELYSRAGNRVHAPAWFLERLPEGCVLDGELFMGRGRFQDVMSVCRSHKEKPEWAHVKFVVFDAPEAAGAIGERLKAARSAVEEAGGCEGSCEVLEHLVCTDEAHVLGELARIETLKGEGVMLRHPGNAYKPGRISDLLKVKSFLDDEALVVGHERGGGKHIGRLGALECRNRARKMFKVGTGFKDHEREDPPAVGTVITYKYFELSRAGIPRFPVYDRVRPDVEAGCFIS